MRTSDKIIKVIPKMFDLVLFGGFLIFMSFFGYQLTVFFKQYSNELQKVAHLIGKLF